MMAPLMPSWLLKGEDYAPRTDREAFIDRSIESLLRVLSKLRAQDRPGKARLAFSAHAKILSTVVAIILLSLSQNPSFLLIAGTVLLVLLGLQRGELILKTLKACIPAAALTFVVMLPSVFWGNSRGVVMISAKVFLSVAAVRLLSGTTGWTPMTRALKAFRVPDIFLLVLDTTVRYIVLLGELSLAMLYAVKLRSVGRNGGKAASISAIAGTLFLKSRDMAEDMYAAMECRCFTGSYAVRRAFTPSPVDALLLALDGLFILAFFATGS
jgi:cobalt/nickel transport system permease protein